jgi:hypothetical protein
MIRYLIPATLLLTLTACAQLTADDYEPEYEARIQATTEKYVSCLNAYGNKYSTSKESASLIIEGALAECDYLADDIEKDVYELEDRKYLSNSFAEDQAEDRVREIKEDARREIVDRLVKERLGDF